MICEHDSLKRKCLICELESDLKIAIEALRRIANADFIELDENGMDDLKMRIVAREALDKID